MKKNLQFLFSLVALMCIALTANAQFADGKYYLQNVESGKYWGAGNDWGTRASLVKNPEYVTLIANEDGTYTLESQVSNGGTNYYFGGDYMDGQPVAGGLTITASGDYYTIANGENYYGYDGTSTVLGKNLAADSKNALWNIISEADMIASLAKATAEAPVDATFLILAQGFGRNNRNSSKWVVSEDCTNKNLSGGNNTNNCAESFHSVFTISQTIADAPKGVYKLTAQGFYRQDGTDNDNLPVFFLNDATSTFPLKTGSENNMSAASASFTNGLYAADPMFITLAEAGDITVGAKLETNTSLWCIWDNFELTYYGPDADAAQIELADYITQVEALRAQATELKGGNVGTATKTALEEALSGSEEIEATKEAYSTAIAALTAAINQAKLDIQNKAAIDALYALAENTNVYTADAYTTYKELVDGYKTAFDEGTLTEAVVNPELVAGWHSSNSFDDLLLSAWTIGGAQCSDFATSLYINTWSVEGESDGTNFKVPFFEYWTGDAYSLGANELTATVEGVKAGDYVVKAWVRVRAKNGTAAADATGITLSANDGEAVDVTEGDAVGQFNIGEYKANATVGEDGKLTITFNVADDNNISWLSFQNVKYITAEESAAEELQKNFEKALPTITDGNYYEIFAEVGETTYYLTAEGKLTADEEEADAFEFKADNTSGAYAKAWSINMFTNPSLSNGSTGDVVNDGSIHSNTANRSGWERQVFFYNGTEYAVRSTNSTGTNWGANTYWAVITDNELPEAGYSLSPNYVWQLKDVTTEVLVASASELLAEAMAVVEAMEGVGDEFFQITEEAYDAYAAAVEVAAAVINDEEATDEEILAAVEALRAANDAYAAAPRVAPEEGKPYVFELTTSEGTYALSISAEGIKIAEEGTNVYFKDMGNGTYALGNEDGEYIVYEGSNNWTMKASTDAYGWTISTTEGGYTIKGKSGLLGTNTSDGAAAGSPCYGDKNASNGYVVWNIEEYTDMPKAPAAPAFATLSTDGSEAQYLYNVEAKAFFVGGNDWGTRASVAADKGYPVMLTANEDGVTYKFNDQLPNGNWNAVDCSDAAGMWVDGAGRSGDGMWTVAIAANGTFTIANNNVADGGNLSVVPSKGDTRLYLSTEDEAQDVWAAVSEEEYNKYLEAYADYLEALDKWNKENYEVGDDIVAFAPAAWEGQTGGYTGLGHTAYERYSGAGSIDAGEVLTQTLTGLKNGTYIVTLELAASYTSGRGFECPTGDDLAVAFANESQEGLTVVDRTWVADGEQTIVTLTASVVNGELTYGIENLEAAGNWYVANVLSIIYASEGVYTDLTPEDFHAWTAADATGEINDAERFYNGDGLDVSTQNVYGNSNVSYLQYADLSDAIALVAVASEGEPRFLLNRVENEGALINIPNDAEQTAKYETVVDNGDGTKTYTIDLEAIIADYGFAHLHSIKGANWANTTVTSLQVVKMPAPIIAYTFERVEGMGYTPDEVAYDEAEILEALEIESWDEIETMYPIVMTTWEAGEDHDGWRDIAGDPMEWNGDGTDLGLCLKYPHDGSFTLCTHPGNDPEAGDELIAGWILGAGNKQVIVTVTVDFIEEPVIDLTFDDLNKVDEVTVAFESETGSYYEGMTSDVDVDAILDKLGVESLDDVDIYAVQSDGSLDSNYGVSTTDGWRDANGDWQGWAGDIEIAPYFYVKADFSKADTQLYEVGGYPGHTDEETTFTATYAFVESGTADAVVLKVTLTYTIPVGINGISGATTVKNGKYLEDGKVVIIKNGTKYSVNGAAIK